MIVDTADTGSSSNSDSDITTLSPVASPRVLNNPEAISISYNQDSMIDGSSAVGRGDNSTFVALEDRLVCFENN
jgi:hypothetical protein